MYSVIERSLSKHPVIFLTIVSLFIFLPSFINGLPPISSYAHNILLHEGFSEQIQSGILYPRWLPELYVGYGGASGFYYPPLLYWISSAFDIVTFNSFTTTSILNAVTYLSLLCSGICFYFFMQQHSSTVTSVYVSILYMMMPYHFPYEIFMRSALSEFLAYVWLPIIFMCIRANMFQKRRLMIGYCLSYTTLILSHLPTALITSIIIGAYCLFFFPLHKKENITFLSKFVFLSLISIGLASIYLLPAIGMLDYMNLEGLEYFDIHNFFIDDLYGEHNDGVLTTLFAFAFSNLVITFLLFFSANIKSNGSNKRLVFFVFTLNVFLFFMMTSYSAFIWDNTPLISSIQFPWRLLVFSEFFTILLFGLYLTNEKDSQTKKQALMGIFIYCTIMYALVYVATFNKPHHLKEITNNIQITQLENKLPNPEHIPKNDFYTPPSLPNLIVIEPRKAVSVVSGEGSVKLEQHDPRMAILQISAESAAKIEFRQFMFHNWQLKDTQTQEYLTEEYDLRAAAPYGQMQFNVPPGEHRILIVLEKTLYEKVAELISLLSLSLFLIWLVLISRIKKIYK